MQAGRLLLTNSAAIRARSLNLEAGAGAGGNISVQVGRLELTGGSQIDSSTRAAKGGALTVTAAEEIAISGGSSGLVSGTYGSGAGGSLTIGTPLLTMDNGLIHAGGFLDSSGRAGDLTVQTGRLTLTGGAQLSTRAEGRGLRGR